MTACRMAAGLQPYLDGALTGEARLTLERHLAGCEGCRRLLEELRQVDDRLRAEPRLAPPEGLAAAIARQAAARQQAMRLVPRRLELVTMGALALAAAGAAVTPYLPPAGLPTATPLLQGALPLAIWGGLAALAAAYFGHTAG